MAPPPTNQAAPLPGNLGHGLKPVIDESLPKTTIRLNLYTGQTVMLELNLTHTVADIHSYVMTAVHTEAEYQLVSGYPPKPLADPGMTIERANL